MKKGKSEKQQNQRDSATSVPHRLLTGNTLKMGISFTGLKDTVFYSTPFADENYEFFNDVNETLLAKNYQERRM